MDKKILEISHLNKRFGNKVIFEDASIAVNKTEFVAIKGQSGAGKTTLLNIIGLLEPFEGSYSLSGYEVDLKKEKEETRRSYFSYVFQEPYLIEYQTVYQNTILPLLNKKIKPNRDEILKTLAYLNIDDLSDKVVYKLSGGERQRVAIARAVVSQGHILLADEPTGNLDSDNSIEVMKIFRKIVDELKITVIMVTHNNALDMYYDRIFYIKDGKIEAQSSFDCREKKASL